jgi:hypothetical protein
MVDYEDTTVFPAPREKVWKLLDAHLDDRAISSIHHLIKAQTTASRSGAETLVDRTIDARGKMLRSRWKITYQPPDLARWEIVDGEGPWKTGSFIENRYAEDPGGTRITGRGDLTISVLPFFMSQKRTIQSVYSDIHDEDVAYARQLT